MCGICGILNLALEPAPDRDRIAAMSARLRHRGPDSDGIFELPHLALAIRRLSIIDLDTGDQPLSNETGEITLVFNGEIYNYRELRQQLIDRGHRFRTHADGEVIAHLYEDRGTDFVRELNGMFAIALWDQRARRLVLARDRAGEKPLYYWVGDGTLVFASEIKSIFEYPGVSRALDPVAVAQYFAHGYFPAPASVFAGIRKLPSAHVGVVEKGEIRLEPYWDLRDHLRPPGSPRLSRRQEGEAVEELQTRLRQAAESRLVSDVPLGVFLSGGVDSSTIVAIMSELSQRLETFSVAFPEKSFNEEDYASRVARRFDTRHHVLRADRKSLREALDILADHLDEPLGDPAVLPTFLMSRFARQQVKVALSGEGSDEIFGGYPTYIGARLARHYLGLPRIVRRQIFDRLARHLRVSAGAVPLGLFLRRFLVYAERPAAERHLIWFGMFPPSQLDQLIEPGFLASRGEGQRHLPEPPSAHTFDPLARVLEGALFDDVPAEMLYLDFRLYLEDNLLVKIDRASMACSLELRTPYLDHRLVEFAAGLPADTKVRNFRLKYLLKKAVEKWLPRPIVYRQKRGFSVPIADWIRRELRPLADETLSETRLKRQGMFSARFVRQLLDEHWRGEADHRRLIWPLLCFELWYDRWVK